MSTTGSAGLKRRNNGRTPNNLTVLGSKKTKEPQTDIEILTIGWMIPSVTNRPPAEVWHLVIVTLTIGWMIPSVTNSPPAEVWT